MLDDKGMKKIMKAFVDLEGRSARVGILGIRNSRQEQGHTNAEIGAKHEFGNEGMPVRSFLRMPISNHLMKYLKSFNLTIKAMQEDVLKNASFEPLLKQIGIVGEIVVADAFQTRGFGVWKPSNMKFKKNHQTLIESTQLRNSITSEVT